MNEVIPIVSFPKSGNTWVRFILANLFKKEINVEINFGNINRYTITEFNDAENFDSSILIDNSPTFIKQHANFCDIEKYDYDKVLYIYRNGFDVIKSYKHFADAQKPGLYPNFMTFVKCYWNYCGHWGDHLDSWLEKNTKTIKVYPIKYESLKDKPIEVFKSLVRFLNFDHRITDNQVKRAIKSSSKDKMKSLNGSKKFMNAKADKFHFVRSAEVGDHKEMNKEVKNVFLSHRLNYEMMVKYNYLNDKDSMILNREDEFYSKAYCRFRKFRYRLFNAVFK